MNVYLKIFLICYACGGFFCAGYVIGSNDYSNGWKGILALLLWGIFGPALTLLALLHEEAVKPLCQFLWLDFVWDMYIWNRNREYSEEQISNINSYVKHLQNKTPLSRWEKRRLKQFLILKSKRIDAGKINQ